MYVYVTITIYTYITQGLAVAGVAAEVPAAHRRRSARGAATAA